MDEIKNVPTLLIGLGGIGSTIVNDVYGRLKSQGRDKNVEAVVFDTDINSQKNMKNIEPNFRIQTSTDKTVNWALEHDTDARQWFPAHPLIGKKQMLDGAGQIRAISRLALRSAMNEGKLNSINEVKERVYRLGNDSSNKGLRVMIVTSMMGGTGSGIFLQIPLYIRDLLQTQFGLDRIEIQGTFLLPDVLLGTVPQKQIENIYANAYASMKELSAIIMSMNGDGSSIDLEYKPNQLDKNGISDITIKDSPYDYCYIYDKENTKGNVLNGFNDYIAMVEENLYLQLFGSISDSIFSNYINEIRGIVKNNGLNIYGGMGTSLLVYPYDDIIDYSTKRMINDSMDNRMLKIDKIFKQEYEQYRKNISEGIDTPEPKRNEVYIRKFEEFAEDDLYFKGIMRKLQKVNDKGDVEATNVELCKENIINEIKDFVSKDENLEEMFKECKIPANFAQLDEKTVSTKVANAETKLQTLRREIEVKTSVKADSKAKTLMGIYGDDAKSILDEYITKDEQFVDSIGVRYFIYKLHQELVKENQAIEEDMKKYQDQLIKNEDGGFVGKDGKKASATKKATEVVVNKGLFDGKVKAFKADYANKNNKHIKLLRNYNELVSKHYFYLSFIELLEAMAKEYENMFGRLEELQYDQTKRMNAMFDVFEKGKGSGKLYVLARKELVEELWNKLPQAVKNGVFDNLLSQKIHEGLFDRYKARVVEKEVTTSGYDELFENVIYQSCRDKVKEETKDILDLNILQALDKEAEIVRPNGQRTDYRRDKIIELIEMTSPWTPKTSASNDFNIFGFNSLSSRSVDANEESIIKSAIDEASDLLHYTIVTDGDIPKNELVYMVTRYGLKVNDFVKFSSANQPDNLTHEDGAYLKAYKEVVSHIQDEGTGSSQSTIAITPHIDKYWHTTLRDINDAEYKKDLLDGAKAFIIGLARKNFEVKVLNDITKEKAFLAKTRDMQAPKTIVCNGASIDNKLRSLYEGLSSNPSIIRSVLADYKNEIDDLNTSIAEMKSSLDNEIVKNLLEVRVLGYDNCKTVLDLMVSYYKETLEKGRIDSLFEGLFDIVEQIVHINCFGQGESVEKIERAKVLKALVENSYWNMMDKDSNEYAQTIGRVVSKIESLEK